ncbi:hypothetical protein IFM89_020225 [Coptis chinensis]|uniref:Trichome birefringence-like N-terminal domain-containing protein n=1 Tax=Coptis chinensis TaxID=261450 RepID=A0A835HNT7_9MAGN|nr:hypothetical protein IFM89_020225 [Coptis chinensis]
MKLASPKAFTLAALPKTISSIAISVGGLALFLIFGSLLLISSPIGSTVQVYFLGRGVGIDHSVNTNTLVVPTLLEVVVPPSANNVQKKSGDVLTPEKISENSPSEISDIKVESVGPVSKNEFWSKEIAPSEVQSVVENSTSVDNQTDEETSVKSLNSTSSELVVNSSKADSGSCDLYHGKWFYDSSGPLYTNNTCPVLTQMQNCQGNGRPDKDYESYRWKPSQCNLPHFDAKKFLELMRGKTLAFIGDSVARNQMESMLCILWQVEVPRNRGNKRMQRWYFKSTSVNIVRIWSSWLIHQTSAPLDFAPAGVVKLHLDAPDEGFMDLLPTFDVVVLSSGHWFAKQSVYVLNNEIVGGQLWWPDNSRPKKIDNVEAFGISVDTILTAMGTHPNYTGLTIVRSYSPDHYEGGAWNTGGSCTGKSRPTLEGELVENGFTNVMHEKQVGGFNKAIQKVSNRSKLRLMDITEAFSYRLDGHPGPYRNPDPNKKTKRGPHGEPPPQDCLHWCMPGPVDTWNEIVLEIIRREYEGTATSTA